MNNRNKGQKVEIIAENELKAKGYNILYKRHICEVSPFLKEHNFAGLFDLVAALGSNWKMIAYAPTMGHYAEKRDEIARFRSKYLIGHSVDCEYWVRVSGAGPTRWRKFYLWVDGWREERDDDGRTATVAP